MNICETIRDKWTWSVSLLNLLGVLKVLWLGFFF